MRQKDYGTHITCRVCGETKTVEEFPMNGKIYRMKFCRECKKRLYPPKPYIRKGYKHADKLEEFAKKWNKENPTVWTNFSLLRAIITQP